jgi:hypothetical protein
MIERIIDLPHPVRVALFGVVAVLIVFLGVLALRTPETETRGDDEPARVSTPAGTVPDATTGTVVDGSAPQAETVIGGYADDVTLDLNLPITGEALKVAAERGVRFTQLSLSYRYDQDDADKAREMSRLLAEDNMVYLGKATPTGSLKTSLFNTKTVVGVKVSNVETVLLSPTALAFVVTATSTTSTAELAPVSSTQSYSLAMTFSGNSWSVSEFSPMSGNEQTELDYQGGE